MTPANIRSRQAETNPDQPALHLPGLNALRFYAALSVVIAHTDHNFGQIRSQSADVWLLNLLAMDAQSAVSLFFVLSGFLITFLLLREGETRGTLSIGRFYIRRALRIWPLYFLLLGIGFIFLPILLPDMNPFLDFPAGKVILVAFFLPNFVTGLGPLEHLWSIGLEEQFYLVWPWVVRSKRHLVKISVGIILVKILVFPAILLIQNEAVSNLYYGLRFECMAIGGLGAYGMHGNSRFLRHLLSVPARLLSIAGMLAIVFFDVPLIEPFVLITGLVFVVLLVNFCAGARWGSRLEHPLLERLGQMSYGIYMYHYPLLYLILVGLARAGIPEGPVYSGLLFLLMIPGTLGIAWVSYRWFEAPFLSLKDRFAFIRTRV
jgi:peptidoglycan/LPS O-acetylase OafA/YrhL